MKTIMSFLLIAIILMVGIKTPKAEEVCYDGVCFSGGDASFADSYVSYDPSTDVEPPYNNPASAEGSPDYAEGEDVRFVSLGCYGVLVVQFTDNSLTTSGDSNADLWIFEIGASVTGGSSEPTNIDISTDGVNWIQVGSTSGDTSGIDIDAYIGSGVVQGEKYSYVRITDRNCVDAGLSYAGADIDAIGAIESAAPVATTSTTTTVSGETTTTTTVSGGETTTTTSISDDCITCETTSECTDAFGSGWACINGCCEDVGGGGDDECTISFVLGETNPQLDTIRRFRDEVLSGNIAGRQIIELYNRHHEKLNSLIEKHPILKKITRKVLESLIPAMELLLEK